MLRRVKIAVVVVFALAFDCRYCISETAGLDSKDANYVDLYNKYISAGRDESANAAGNYKKAFELFVKLPPDFNGLDLNLWPQKLPEKKLNAVKDWISASKYSLEQLKIGSQKDAYWVELKNQHLHDYSSYQDLVKFRLLNLALTFRSKLNAINGDFNGSFSDLLAVFSIGNQFSSRKLLVEQLVGCALRTLAVRASFEILSNSAVSPSDLKKLQEKFNALSGKTQKIDFYPEKLFTLDYLQDLFTDDGKGNGFVSEKTVENESQKQKQYLFSEFTEEEKQKYRALKKNETFVLAEKYRNYFEQIKDKTPYQAKRENCQKILIDMTKDNVIFSKDVTSHFITS